MKTIANMRKKIERFTILITTYAFFLSFSTIQAQIKVDSIKAEGKYEIAEITVKRPIFSGTKGAEKINQYFREKIARPTPQEQVDAFIGEYKKMVEDFGSENIFGYFTEVSYEILLNEKNLLCFEITYIDYLGGAHGTYGSSFYVFDTQTGQRLMLKDLLVEGYEPTLLKEAEASLREFYQIPPDQTLADFGFWFENGQMKLNDNFYITNKGIGFFYNIYEIAPYVVGSSDVFIPYNKISAYIPKKGYLSAYK